MYLVENLAANGRSCSERTGRDARAPFAKIRFISPAIPRYPGRPSRVARGLQRGGRGHVAFGASVRQNNRNSQNEPGMSFGISRPSGKKPTVGRAPTAATDGGSGETE